MTEVDFYILAASEADEQLLFACRLAEKAYRSKRQIYIHTDSAAQAKRIDEYLWSYRAESFVPHNLLDESPDMPAAVEIGYREDPGHHQDVLINLSSSIPRFFSRFHRVAEIVIQEPGILERTRSNYTFYKERGYPLKTNDLRNK